MTMNDQWKQFLEGRGARTDEDGRLRFEDGIPFPDCALFDLSHLGLILAEGEDTETFLQGQLTGDMRAVTASHSLTTGYCTPKGRMLASFRAFRIGQAIGLQLPRELLAGTLKRLQMFVLRSKVLLHDASDEQVRIGVAGDCAAERLAGRLGRVPQADNEVLQAEGITCIRLPGAPARFECIAAPEKAQSLWKALEKDAVPADAGYWALMDIQAGIPTIFPATTEAFVPQMANLHLIGGVGFKKGCYTGQEIVARMQYLGKLKRRMYLAHVEAETLPRPGDELYSASSTSEQGTGRVVDAQAAPQGGYDLLAVVEIASAEGAGVHLGAPDGPELQLRPPPYGFEGS
jgi:folate-binding protein YgfZ